MCRHDDVKTDHDYWPVTGSMPTRLFFVFFFGRWIDKYRRYIYIYISLSLSLSQVLWNICILAAAPHQHILGFIALQGGWLVTELCQGGSLLDLLHATIGGLGRRLVCMRPSAALGRRLVAKALQQVLSHPAEEAAFVERID